MNSAQYLCKILEAKGVKYIFGLFGDIQTDFAHAVRRSSLKWVGVHNEKSGGFAADIYARVSGKPGIIFTTLGPGGTNLTSALANANQDRSPLIAISDQVSSEEYHLGTHQYINFEKAFGYETGIAKSTFVVKNTREIKKVINEAFKVATEEPKGSVHISIMSNVFGEEVNFDGKELKEKLSRKAQTSNCRSSISYSDLLKRIQLNENRGIVIAGGSIERNKAKKEFISFVEKFDLPVLTTFRGKNSIPGDHRQCLGTISRHLAEVVNQAISSAGFVLTIGYDYNEGVKPSLWKGKEKQLLNIDSFDNRVKGIFNPPSLFGDLKSIFSNLSKENRPNYKDKFDYNSFKEKLQSVILKKLEVKNSELNPIRITEAINKVFGEKSIIVCDIGLNKYYSGLSLKATNSNQIIFSNGQSAMAFSSGAVGAKFASPNKNVIALVGDGGFLMDFQEVLTSIECKKPVIWIVFNNGGLGLVEQAQRKNSPYVHGVHFDKIFFEKIAHAFGAVGESLNSGEDLLPILKRAKNLNKTTIIDVPVQYTPKRKNY